MCYQKPVFAVQLIDRFGTRKLGENRPRQDWEWHDAMNCIIALGNCRDQDTLSNWLSIKKRFELLDLNLRSVVMNELVQFANRIVREHAELMEAQR